MATIEVNADEYYLDDDNFGGNDEQIDGLKARLREYRSAAANALEMFEKLWPKLPSDLDDILIQGIDPLRDLGLDTVDVDPSDLPYDSPLLSGRED